MIEIADHVKYDDVQEWSFRFGEVPSTSNKETDRDAQN
jgi:hypothetical protein